MIKNRSVVTVIVLTIVTCGIYGLYWYWQAMSSLDEAGKKSNMPPIAQFLLLFLYVGGIVFAINANNNINAIRANKGLPEQDNMVLWLILFIVFPIAGVALVQSAMNEVADC
ncbi:MAG: DUF4234 domain-containing protein [Oscillospiraceae bacterium]|nr:DUF4234 domain-containing protein [Oscillospiraceae bacterium]